MIKNSQNVEKAQASGVAKGICNINNELKLPVLQSFFFVDKLADDQIILF